MRVFVRNMRGSSKIAPTPSCRCNDWIEHWENNSWLNVPYDCPICGKHPTDTNHMVGGHVQKVKRSDILPFTFVLDEDETHYIVPICESCNKRGALVFAIDDSYLVKSSRSSCVQP